MMWSKGGNPEALPNSRKQPLMRSPLFGTFGMPPSSSGQQTSHLRLASKVSSPNIVVRMAYMRKMPPLHALRAFEAAARHASVTQAAEELGVSHSAVSQQVRSLEEYFGQPLFHRNGRRVEPTEQARALLDDIRTAFDRIAVAAEQFNARNGNAVITVNTTPSFAMRWLIPRSSTFQIENPSVSVVVETSTSDGIDHLTKNYDFIFRRAPMERIDHRCRKVLDDR